MSSLSDFKILSKLGEGAYSTVYKVRRLQDSQEYAMKKVKLLTLSEKEKENAMSEIRILASIRNPNVIAYKECFIDFPSNSLCIIMEFCDDGDLYQKIQQHQKLSTYLEEKDIWRFFIQIVLGVKCLHDLNILHRDLKSANVFLNKDGTCKIGDMNVSKVAKDRFLKTQTGTPYYASPELWKDLEYDQKSDIWSLGCVLFETVCLYPPFRADDMEGLYRQVVRGSYPGIPKHFSKSLNKLLKLLLQVSPKLRPSCDGILSLPYVQKYLDEPFFFSCENEKNQLAKTIRFNNNFIHLSNALPHPNYSLPYLKPIDKIAIMSELKIHKKGSMSSSEKHLKLPKLRGHNFKVQKKILDVHKSFDSPRIDLDPFEASESANSSQRKKKKYENFFKNCLIDMGEHYKHHPKFNKKIPEILDVYGIQKKKQKKFNDSMNSIKKQILNLKEVKDVSKNKELRSKSTKELPKLIQNKKSFKLSSDSHLIKIRKLTNLGKAYEISLDKIDEMQENCNLERMIPVSKKYKEKIMLGSLLDVISSNYQY